VAVRVAVRVAEECAYAGVKDKAAEIELQISDALEIIGKENGK